MLISNQTLLDDILEVFTSEKYDDIDTLYALEAIRIRERAYRREEQRNAQQRARDAIYQLVRVEKVQVFDAHGNSGYQKRAVERVEVRKGDFPQFANERGFTVNDLITLTQERRKPAVAKDGSVWEVPIMLPPNNETTFEPLDSEGAVRAREIAQRNQRIQASQDELRKEPALTRYAPTVRIDS